MVKVLFRTVWYCLVYGEYALDELFRVFWVYLGSSSAEDALEGDTLTPTPSAIRDSADQKDRDLRRKRRRSRIGRESLMEDPM